jgi:hypothetical protein
MGKWPDQRSVHFPVLAHIPVPVTCMGSSCPNKVIVPTMAWALDIASANSYEELWPIFVAGISVPEVFTHLFTGSCSCLLLTWLALHSWVTP